MNILSAAGWVAGTVVASTVVGKMAFGVGITRGIVQGMSRDGHEPTVDEAVGALNKAAHLGWVFEPKPIVLQESTTVEVTVTAEG